ncbi:MAG: hypothetical protein JWQ43_836 [Glaciihabitans sp.]|nr:hypothetical protein [Glaciihabitans sp.]
MTLFDTRPVTNAAPVEIVWSTPDRNLWVAMVNGDYAGMIEFTDGHFVVRDMANHIVATAVSIPAAQYLFAQNLGSRPRSAAARLVSSLASGTHRGAFLDLHPRPGYVRHQPRRS